MVSLSDKYSDSKKMAIKITLQYCYNFGQYWFITDPAGKSDLKLYNLNPKSNQKRIYCILTGVTLPCKTTGRLLSGLMVTLKTYSIPWSKRLPH